MPASLVGKEKFMNISISERNFLPAIILAIIFLFAIITGLVLIQQSPASPPVLSGENSLASTAAVSALQAFFQIDYQEGKEAWLNRICALTTTTGCQLISEGADSLWGSIQENKTFVNATIEPVRKTAQTPSEQVWLLSITLSGPLPGSTKTKDTSYVAVSKTADGWKFDRFLMDAEVQAILNRKTQGNNP
jgi:hypothetical protein